MSSTGHLLAHGGSSSTGWWPWTVPVLAALAPASLYLIGVLRIRRHHRRPWSRWRTASFLVGCALLAVALAPPVENFAAHDARGHMVQHLLLGMYAPLGLVLGAPLTLLLGSLPVSARPRVRAVLARRWVRWPTNLAVATALSAGGLYLLYLTPLYALSTRSDLVHHLTHLHFLAAGYVFTWAVTGPDPAPTRPRTAWRVAALIVAAGAHNFLAKLLYSRATALPSGAALPRSEVEAAAQWMYYGGHLAEALILIALFATWYRGVPRVRGHRRASEELPPATTDMRLAS